MSVNFKTVTVLHVGVGGRGDEFLGRAGAGGAGQDGGRLVVVFSYYSCTNTSPFLGTNSL